MLNLSCRTKPTALFITRTQTQKVWSYKSVISELSSYWFVKIKGEINPICLQLHRYINDKNMSVALKIHQRSLLFSVGAVNEEMIEKALSTRMKTGYKSWLSSQNFLSKLNYHRKNRITGESNLSAELRQHWR